MVNDSHGCRLSARLGSGLVGHAEDAYGFVEAFRDELATLRERVSLAGEQAADGLGNENLAPVGLRGDS